MHWHGEAGGWASACFDGRGPARHAPDTIPIGVIPGEGVGPEVIAAALDVLEVVVGSRAVVTEFRHDCSIGRAAERAGQSALPREAVAFCRETFARGGAILNGPGGGRYVYDLRREFELFLKISPIQTALGLPDASPFRREHLDAVDILMTRENCGGVYQGQSHAYSDADGERSVRHAFSYHEQRVRRFLDASARLAASRSGGLTVVWKESGVPAVSGMWRDCAAAAARDTGIAWNMVDVDLMAYRLVTQPGVFDVVAAPNLCGDILADLAAALLGSRGLSYSGNYREDGVAVYQTNHGSAHDLAGTDTANPGGQILAMAMMLGESFGLVREADTVRRALRGLWRQGFRTADVAAPASRVVGTREFGRRVAGRAAALLRAAAASE